ncbi:F420-dependent oxidoreductase, MSMEG_4879 family (modular protein) [Frankia canadensis]|uniref:F420-dependent oxidoreductase, MSMEG_4879 family (Modular protein) n=1 Tax=Frankia canadensis TaxID=1836972 RepID=A0A2I2KSP8_9ACTN|nr:TIGR03564 family F420-dependent LLM class oxidoreductase [Frankia canadensis]SNQ48694.1 F420-dependent oxidoreductase, MSMEG_4879 family (modular protein) [Frankia canadensis]SOU55984.1 F420-dependent oxidoreductase, MSMEG_4879 family (modular protein) [Frankia canadensis]
MDIAVYVGDVSGPSSLEESVTAARTAACGGASAVWAAQALGWDSLTLLALVGAAVPEIGLGTGVVPVAQRHPLVLAGQALSVQAAVGGRLTLGIGAGVGAMVGGVFGLPHDQPARRMREYLSVLGPLLRGEAVEHHGETLTAVGQIDLPTTCPPPVLLAALGPHMLRVAGELTDGTVTWMAGPRSLGQHIVPTLTRAARTAGRDDPRVVAGALVCVTDDRDSARGRIAARYALAGQVREYRAVLDREGVGGAQDVAVIGDEDSVARHLRGFADAGVTELAAAPFGTAQEKARTTAVLAGLAPSGARRSRPLTTSDRVAIHELIALHGHLADDRRSEDLALLFTPDAVYDVTAYGLGAVDGLPAIARLHHERPGAQPAGHHVSNIIIDDRPDGTATVRSKGLAVMADGRTGTCLYDDTVTHTDAGWRISHRRVRSPRTD